MGSTTLNNLGNQYGGYNSNNATSGRGGFRGYAR
jgi:hypothetical protein